MKVSLVGGATYTDYEGAARVQVSITGRVYITAGKHVCVEFSEEEALALVGAVSRARERFLDYSSLEQTVTGRLSAPGPGWHEQPRELSVSSSERERRRDAAENPRWGEC